jgi:hypothetical protein
MFQALLVHPQEALHKRHLVCFMRVMSVGCTPILVQPTDNTYAIYQVPFVLGFLMMSK